MGLETLGGRNRKKGNRKGISMTSSPDQWFPGALGEFVKRQIPGPPSQEFSDSTNLGVSGEFSFLTSSPSVSNLGPVTTGYRSGDLHMTPPWTPPNFLSLCGFPLAGTAFRTASPTTTPSLALNARLVTGTSAAGSWR